MEVLNITEQKCVIWIYFWNSVILLHKWGKHYSYIWIFSYIIVSYGYTQDYLPSWFGGAWICCTASDWMTASIFSHEGLVLTSSHLSSILLQQRLKFVGHSASIVFSFPMGRPNFSPICFHFSACFGVTSLYNFASNEWTRM